MLKFARSGSQRGKEKQWTKRNYLSLIPKQTVPITTRAERIIHNGYFVRSLYRHQHVGAQDVCHLDRANYESGFACSRVVVVWNIRKHDVGSSLRNLLSDDRWSTPRRWDSSFEGFPDWLFVSCCQRTFAAANYARHEIWQRSMTAMSLEMRWLLFDDCKCPGGLERRLPQWPCRTLQ